MHGCRSYVSALAFSSALLFCAAQHSTAQTPPRPGAGPTDEQVKKDVWRDGAGKLRIETTAGKAGEFEFDPVSRTWFFQRGFVVTRTGNLPGFPNANLEVGGLAVYRWTGGTWQFHKELTTFNRSTGIPSPSETELIALARTNAQMVFRAQIRNMPQGLGTLALSTEVPMKWHNANSLSYYLDASYTYRVPSNGQVVPCTTLWEVRIYRNTPQSPWRDPVGLYKKVLAGCGAPGR